MRKISLPSGSKFEVFMLNKEGDNNQYILLDNKITQVNKIKINKHKKIKMFIPTNIKCCTLETNIIICKLYLNKNNHAYSMLVN